LQSQPSTLKVINGCITPLTKMEKNQF
jgi:hypothetical protein